MHPRGSTEMAHVTRDHGDRPSRFSIECPYCHAPLGSGLTLPELRERHDVRPGDAITSACGHIYRLPQPFPSA
jgi:hypothetical protein